MAWTALCPNGHFYSGFSGGAPSCYECDLPPAREIACPHLMGQNEDKCDCATIILEPPVEVVPKGSERAECAGELQVLVDTFWKESGWKPLAFEALAAKWRKAPAKPPEATRSDMARVDFMGLASEVFGEKPPEAGHCEHEWLYGYACTDLEGCAFIVRLADREDADEEHDEHRKTYTGCRGTLVKVHGPDPGIRREP